jgi:PAS domain S-box-containing protein
MSLWCLRFAFQYTGQDKWLTPRTNLFLSVIPIATLLLNWTNEWHGLYYSNVEVGISNGIPVLVLTKGIWYWVHIANFYTSFTIMVLLILRMCWRRGSLYLSQALTIVLGALPPCIGNVLYLANLTPFPNLDLSPFGFAIMGSAMLLGLFRYHIFNVVPVARDMLIETMNDGVLVLDIENRVVDINPTAQRLIGSPASIGQNVETLLSAWPEFLTCCRDEEKMHQEIMREGTIPQYFDVRTMHLNDRQGEKRGRLIILRDITAQKQLEAEREDLIDTLQSALSRVKTLTGLLPICASCKKIRDDQGYWHQVETYISKHTEADFSHGICPSCAQKLYPEVFDKIKSDIKTHPSPSPSPKREGET